MYCTVDVKKIWLGSSQPPEVSEKSFFFFFLSLQKGIFQWTDVSLISDLISFTCWQVLQLSHRNELHFIPLNNRSLWLPHHQPFSLCTAVRTMCSCVLMRQIMSPRSRQTGHHPLGKSLGVSGMEEVFSMSQRTLSECNFHYRQGRYASLY